MPRSLAVELCGLPGSGKTTAALGARDTLAAWGLPCEIGDRGISAAAPARDRIRRRGASALRELARQPVSALFASGNVLSARQARSRDAIAGLAQWLAMRDLVAGSHRASQTVLFEEGILQRLWTLGLRSERDVSDSLWRGLDAPRRTDLVVVLDVAVSDASERLAARQSQHSRTQRLTPAGRLEELGRGQSLLGSLLERCPVPVTHVQATLSPALVAEQVALAVLDAAYGRSARQ